MAHHRLDASPDTVHWGFFDAALAPVLTVDPGDTVTVSTVSGRPEVMPGPPLRVPEPLAAIHARHRPRLPGHICTGPIAVRGARAGQTLEVRIRDIGLFYDWGYTRVGPDEGALPGEFAEATVLHTVLDAGRMTGRLPWGQELALRPFFGVMGVAPPADWGVISTIEPRRNGGNLDNKELVAGTTLFLPIHMDGALFSIGDGHGLQGDGEVCGTAIETGLVGTLEFHLHDRPLVWPEAETPSHVITLAFDPDLDECVRIALRSMIDLISSRTALSRAQAFALCSLAADVRVTQVVNGHNGAHVMLARALLGGSEQGRA